MFRNGLDNGGSSPRLNSAIQHWKREWFRTKPSASGNISSFADEDKPERKCVKPVPDKSFNLNNDSFEYHTTSRYRNCCTCDILAEYWNKPLELTEEGEIFDDDSLVSTAWRLTGPQYTDCDFTLRNTFGKLFVKVREIHKKYQTLSIDQLTYFEAQDRMTSDFVESAFSWFKFPHTYLVDMLNFFNRPSASLRYSRTQDQALSHDNVDLNLLQKISYDLESKDGPVLDSLEAFHKKGHWYLHKRCYCDRMCFENSF